MSILSVLTHRATVRRSTSVLVNGSPVQTWSDVHHLPCLFSKDPSEFDPTWTASQRRESDQRGTLFALPTADIKPGDRIKITRPAMSGSFEVLPDPSEILALHQSSHREFKVREVS